MKAQAIRDSSCDCPEPADPGPFPVDPAARDALLARYAKALGHPARVAIVRLLAERRTCVCGEIVDELPYAQSTVSQHLQVLKEAGLIRGEVAGPRSCYCLEPAALDLLVLLASELKGTR